MDICEKTQMDAMFMSRALDDALASLTGVAIFELRDVMSQKRWEWSSRETSPGNDLS